MALQNHIHLGLTLGGAPENAPSQKWKTTKRILVPEVVVGLKRGLTGKLFTHRLQSAGAAIKFRNLQFTIKVDTNEIENLLALNGETVYFVDADHPNDGEDHTNSVRTMFCTVGEFSNFEPLLRRYYVEVSLTDNDTVI